MKNIIIPFLILFSFCVVNAQDNRTVILDDLENNQAPSQEATSAFTATLKAASRLFADKDDLTSVMLVIPSGSEVDVLGADSTYLHVVFENAEGYIFKRHAVIKQTPFASRPAVQPRETVQQAEPQPQQRQEPQPQESRFTYLENKYGTSLAAKLIAGKIWKGMTAEMVRDSWGRPAKINRVISGNTLKEEWIYSNTWLYIEDDILFTWGPVSK